MSKYQHLVSDTSEEWGNNIELFLLKILSNDLSRGLAVMQAQCWNSAHHGRDDAFQSTNTNTIRSGKFWINQNHRKCCKKKFILGGPTECSSFILKSRFMSSLEQTNLSWFPLSFSLCYLKFVHIGVFIPEPPGWPHKMSFPCILQL